MRKSRWFILLGLGFEMEDAFFLNLGYQTFGIILGCVGLFYILLGLWQTKWEHGKE